MKWFVVESSSGEVYVRKTPDAVQYQMAICKVMTGSAQMKNARLISSAPEMFELLESSLIALQNGCESESDRNGLIVAIQEIIEKAKG